MESRYSPKTIEPYWQKLWQEKAIFKQYARPKKFYALDMFPYPSGFGLHVGHPKGYIATDVVARAKQLQGYGVLHPMGWDAFGLPAEQFALKNKVHPSAAVANNIATYKRQLDAIGFTYDWDREINTTDPRYYRWTQWIFLKMFEKGLAYESDEPINWCPSCQTGLANEDLDDGACERCGTIVEQKPMRQWVLRMTAYADRLLEGLDRKELEWSEEIKAQQRHWIGRSEGAEAMFRIRDTEASVVVFTTRLDTIFGCTGIIVAPEHPFLTDHTEKISNADEVAAYLAAATKKSDRERGDREKEKTGVKLEGVEAINPCTGESVPVFVADYVLGGYGTGAVMLVPAHDERDFEFAKKYGLPIKKSIASIEEKNQEISGIGVLIELEDGKLFFQKRDENTDRDPGRISPFGGGREDNETTVECVQRELMEEISVNVEPAQIATMGIFKSKNRPGQFIEMFVVSGVRKDSVHVSEGVGGITLSIEGALSDSRVTEFTKETIRSYQGQRDKKNQAFTNDGILVDSGEFTGLSSGEARKKIAGFLEEKNLGKKTVKYRMRDWTFSRQRYWGEPIPIIHCERCGAVPVPEKDLPVKLPEVESYAPTGTGESPLADIPEWVNVPCPKCGVAGKRETNTMPQWAGSSWYYLRFIDPTNEKSLVGGEVEAEWMPVDLYVGGIEHATRHLLYARFWHKFLFDLGVVSTDEPFKRLVHVGLINASDGRKMSKRWGNVVNPDDIIRDFGADAFRLYELFMGPFTQNISWNTEGLVGTRRFLDKVWSVRSHVSEENDVTDAAPLEALLQRTIGKVTEDIDAFRFNTAISSLMILANAMGKEQRISKACYETFVLLLSPFAPHIAEELWRSLGHEQSIFLASWPAYDDSKVLEESIVMTISINGKMRDLMTVPQGISEEDLRDQALDREKIRPFLEGKTVKKIIVVPGRIVNIVI